jgi:hypothetical protein
MVGVCASLFHMAIVDCLNKKSKKETKWPDLSLRKQVEKAFSYSKNKDNLLFSNKLYEYAKDLQKRNKILKEIRRCKYIMKHDKEPHKKKYKKIIKKAGDVAGVSDYHDQLVLKLGHPPQLPKKKEWWVLNTNTNKRVNFPLESYGVRNLTH